MKKDISVIISTYNSPEWLAKVLYGYNAQTFRNFEVIIADDGSDERTKKCIDELQKEVFSSGTKTDSHIKFHFNFNSYSIHYLCGYENKNAQEKQGQCNYPWLL